MLMSLNRAGKRGNAAGNVGEENNSSADSNDPFLFNFGLTQSPAVQDTSLTQICVKGHTAGLAM
jgi:hypothetical protein